MFSLHCSLSISPLPILAFLVRSAARVNCCAEAARLLHLPDTENRVDRWLAQLHAPTGLDLGADTPAAIALSILAEIQQALTAATGAAAAPGARGILTECSSMLRQRVLQRCRAATDPSGCLVRQVRLQHVQKLRQPYRMRGPCGTCHQVSIHDASLKSSFTNVPPANSTSGAHAG